MNLLSANHACSRRIDVGKGSFKGFVDVGEETQMCSVDLLCIFLLALRRLLQKENHVTFANAEQSKRP